MVETPKQLPWLQVYIFTHYKKVVRHVLRVNNSIISCVATLTLLQVKSP